MISPTPMLARIETQLHRGFARGGDYRCTSAFGIYLWPESALFYRNRALPLACPPAWRPALLEVTRQFGGQVRDLRLEFFPQRWLGLAAALQACGFERELEAPVLVLERDRFRPGNSEARFLHADDPPPLHEDFLAQGQRAFEMSPGTHAAELAYLRAELRDRTTLIAVRLERGMPVAGASLIGLGAEAELAGVWTVPERRRRGCAAMVCRALLTRFFGDGGELVWLAAAGHGSVPLYERLGFQRIATQLTFALLKGDGGAARGKGPA